MNNRQKFWLAFSAVVLIVFLKLIPIGVFDLSPIFWSFVGGILLFIGLFMAMGDYTSIDELTDKSEKAKKNLTPGRKWAPVMVAPALIMVFVFLLVNSYRKSNVLETEGVFVKGYILDGDATTTTRRMRTSTSFTLYYKFIDSTGITRYGEATVSSSDFNSTYQGDEVDIVYWREDPSVSRVVMSQEDLVKFKDIPTGTIKLDDLIKVYSMSSQDSIVNYLNSINYEWKYENGLYINEGLQLAIKIEGEDIKALTYISQSHSQESIEKELVTKGFEKEATTENERAIYTYSKDGVVIRKTNDMQKDNSSSYGAFKIYDIYQLVILK
ncbi:MAG: hypothetical protein U0U66_12610 [Cytophagaceae bacterium]